MQIRKIEDKIYKLGEMNRLEVVRFMPQGAYLKISNNEDEVLLPKRYVDADLKEGDCVDVFIYNDNEGRLTATTLEPLAKVGETKTLSCVACNDIGAFLSWGIHKDLLVPYAEQLHKMQEGKCYTVHLYVDSISGKIVASSKLHKHIGNAIPEFKPSERVEAIVVEKNDVGYRTVVNNIYWGIIYYSDIEEPLEIGSEYPAYVVRVREDGKIDLSINPVGYAKIELNEENLLKLLNSNNGFLSIGDKSDAKEIKSITGLSKKAFKMTVGALYKKGIIIPSDKEIRLK